MSYEWVRYVKNTHPLGVEPPAITRLPSCVNTADAMLTAPNGKRSSYTISDPGVTDDNAGLVMS